MSKTHPSAGNVIVGKGPFFICGGKIKKYWSNIHVQIESILGEIFSKKPITYLLGPMFQFKAISKDNMHLMFHFIVAARIILAKLWKTEHLPTIEECRKKSNNFM
uniref:Uncharacterized protein n=1 Tax=Sphaerodactylus townsendi TaxID=933632 RepID=A0ACB8F5V8_9SAUR